MLGGSQPLATPAPGGADTTHINTPFKIIIKVTFKVRKYIQIEGRNLKALNIKSWPNYCKNVHHTLLFYVL